jgi:RNA polymerase sigma factor (sigma-70 family)
MTTMTTKHVDDAAVEHEASPLDVLVAGHRNFLGFLERHTGDRALAEDILQSAFVRGLERADQVRDTESVTAWFYRVLRNAVVDHQRRTATAARSLERLAQSLDDMDRALPDDRERVCECLGDLATSLSPEHAEAIRRVDLDGLAVKDYAAEAGISASNAGVRLFRARGNLRKAVARCCGTCAEHGCRDCSCRSSRGPSYSEP